MLNNDAFSKLLGMQFISLTENTCSIQMKVTPQFTNGFKVAHGAVTYALADSALAFLSNASGQQSVSVETAISHTKKVLAGDVLTAKAQFINQTSKLGWYEVEIFNQHQQMVAHFKGTVFITKNIWQDDE